MCGRFDSHLPKMHGWTDILEDWPEYRASFNTAPGAQIAAFARFSRLQHPDATQGQSMRWGMVPSWAESFESKYATFNARLETIASKPSFRNAWRKQQRCLIPMHGYYEWQKREDGKQPFFITDRNVGGLVTAGLYELWGLEGDLRYSCTMITRPADSSLAAIHGRMPVLLTPQSASEWMQLENPLADDFLAETVSPDVVYWPVDKRVGNVRNNDPDLVKPIDQNQSG